MNVGHIFGSFGSNVVLLSTQKFHFHLRIYACRVELAYKRRIHSVTEAQKRYRLYKACITGLNFVKHDKKGLKMMLLYSLAELRWCFVPMKHADLDPCCQHCSIT